MNTSIQNDNIVFFVEREKKMSKESSTRKNIGEIIKKYRNMKGMTASGLSKKSNIAASNISAIEAGDRLPKIEMCNSIAHALEVDPVEICCLDLTETDRRRLLMKLLAEFADDIEIVVVPDASGNTDLDHQNIKLDVKLPVDFMDFANRYKEKTLCVEQALKDISEDDPRYELIKENAEDEFNYWLESYPAYDAVTRARREGDKLTFDTINIWSTIIDQEMQPGFYMYQRDYMIPSRKTAWELKHGKIKDE